MRVRTDFYARVWQLLHAVEAVWFGAPGPEAARLDAAVVRSDYTAQERDFAHVIEPFIARLADPRYRTLTLEALNVLAEYTARHPGKRLCGGDLDTDGGLSLDRLIHAAVAHLPLEAEGNEARWSAAFAARPDQWAQALQQVATTHYRLA